MLNTIAYFKKKLYLCTGFNETHHPQPFCTIQSLNCFRFATGALVGLSG